MKSKRKCDNFLLLFFGRQFQVNGIIEEKNYQNSKSYTKNFVFVQFFLQNIVIMAPFRNYEKLFEFVKLYLCLYNRSGEDFKKEATKQNKESGIVLSFFQRENSCTKIVFYFLFSSRRLLHCRKANDARSRACDLHVIVLFHEITFTSLAITSAQFKLVATETYRAILKHRLKIIIVPRN